MTEGTDNVEGRLSCDDSSHNERNLRFPTAAIVFTVEARARHTVVAVQTCWERSLTSLNLLEPSRVFAGTEDNFAIVHPASTSAPRWS